MAYENYNYKQLKTLRSKKLAKISGYKKVESPPTDIIDRLFKELAEIDQRLKEMGD